MVTWKCPVQGDREEKGTRSTTPKHANKTQPVLHSKVERVPNMRPYAHSYRRRPRVPFLVTLWALVIIERGTTSEVGAPHFEKLPFLETIYFLFPQIGSPAHITHSE